MLFSDLLDLPFDENTSIISRTAIVNALPDTPETIAFDVYSDHGRKTDFQTMYGNLCISTIAWNLTATTADIICAASMNPQFCRWFENVRRRLSDFEIDGWGCIDVRESVVKHWSANRTWVKPPIFVDKSLIDLDRCLHLVEGHTRTAVLAGLLDIGVEVPESEHDIWLGTSQPEQSGKTP